MTNNEANSKTNRKPKSAFTTVLNELTAERRRAWEEKDDARAWAFTDAINILLEHQLALLSGREPRSLAERSGRS